MTDTKQWNGVERRKGERRKGLERCTSSVWQGYIFFPPHDGNQHFPQRNRRRSGSDRRAAPQAATAIEPAAEQWMFNVADKIVWLVRGYADNIAQRHHAAVGEVVDILASSVASAIAAPAAVGAREWRIHNDTRFMLDPEPPKTYGDAEVDAMLDAYAASQTAALREELLAELPCGHKTANLYEPTLGEQWSACPICAMKDGIAARAEAAERRVEALRAGILELANMSDVNAVVCRALDLLAEKE